jgi:3-dehydroquinate synthase
LEQNMAGILKMEDGPISMTIQRSCEIKAQVVAEDEREGDRRRILNYGHTLGHALETIGRYRALIHGEAVAIGMVQEASLSASLGYCGSDVVDRIQDLVAAADLPHRLPRSTEASLWGAMRHDKKVLHGKVYGVWPVRIGEVRVAPLERSAFKRWYADQRRRGPHGA